MYWPSISCDAEFVFESQDGDPLDVDAVLGTYDDWRDVSQWSHSSREGPLSGERGSTQTDPTVKPGLVGAFCRIYTVPEAIEALLTGMYTPHRTGRPLVIHDEAVFCFSHHVTD